MSDLTTGAHEIIACVKELRAENATLTAERDALRAEVERLRTDNALLEVRWHKANLLCRKKMAERDALHDILAGRDRAPTDAEIEAHAATDGARWKGAIDGDVVYLEKRPSAAVRAQTGLRWWAVDGTDNPCAWPEVE